MRAQPLLLIDVEFAEYRWLSMTYLTKIAGAVNLVEVIDFSHEVRPLIPSPSPTRGEGNKSGISDLGTNSLSLLPHQAPLS